VHTYNRTIPNRFFYGNSQKKRGFLRGLFSANGFVVAEGKRVGLKASSKVLIEQVQEMLSSIGIHSYITTNKSKLNEFPNGLYQMKKSYDLNISPDRVKFLFNIGFLQKYKNDKVHRSSSIRNRNTASEIKEVIYLGEHEVFDITVDDKNHTYWTGGCLVSNCTEFVSEDDSDVCNLGSVNIANVESIDELKDVMYLASWFLAAGTVRGVVPDEEVEAVREKNRKVGLGIMGVHEFLLKKGSKYEVTPELKKYLEVYKEYSEKGANDFCDRFYLNRPESYRAIAPTGTIGLITGTTTGIEPLFAVAYKRRYLEGDKWKYEYAVDSTAYDMINKYGVEPEDIDTANSLAKDVERRIKFQADIQDYVDMAISSTINLPAWGTKYNNDKLLDNYSDIIKKYADRIRGLTFYPDGSRGGQPLETVDYNTAMKNKGTVFEENESCKGGVCGV